MYKKSQAALEFLTTYGWAFLVIIIMIGTLAYFGILSPSKILPNRCNFGAEFQCLDHQIAGGGTTLKIRLKNNVGESITVSSMTFTSESTTAFSCTIPPTMPSSWTSGTVQDLAWTGCSGGGLVGGEKGKIGVVVTYYSVSSGSTYSKQVKGEIFSAVT